MLAQYNPLQVFRKSWDVVQDIVNPSKRPILEGEYFYEPSVPTPTKDFPTPTQPFRAPTAVLSFPNLPLSLKWPNQDFLMAYICVFVMCLLTLRYYWLKSPIQLYHATKTSPVCFYGKVEKMPLDRYLNRHCPTLTDPQHNSFYPHFLFSNGHLQTIASVLAPHYVEPRVSFTRELLTMKDGGHVSLDWADVAQDRSNICFFLHGLTGGSHELYVQDLIVECAKYGYASVVMNFRGCCETELVTPRLYSAACTDDLSNALIHVRSKYPEANIIGIGFSLGSNVLLNYAGQQRENCFLSGVISIGNPYDLMGAVRELHRTWVGKNLYSVKMGQNLVRIFSKFAHLFEDQVDMDKVTGATNILEFDQYCTSVLGGFKTVYEYYRQASCVRHIPYINVPCLLFTALDDPIAHQECIPWFEVASNPNVILATTATGGHLGWFRSGWDNLIPTERWFPKPVGEFIHAIFKAKSSLPKPVLPTETREIIVAPHPVKQVVRSPFSRLLPMVRAVLQTFAKIPFFAFIIGYWLRGRKLLI